MNALEAAQPSPFHLTIFRNSCAKTEKYINVLIIRKNADFFWIEYLS